MSANSGSRPCDRLGRPLVVVLLVALLGLVAACSGSSATSDATQSDSTTTSDGNNPNDTSDASNPGDTSSGGDSTVGDGESFVCYGPDSQYPSFDRSCSQSGDCVIAFHTTSCCGAEHAMGIKASEKARFDSLESTCVGQLPLCGCFSETLTLDDGQTTLDKRNSVQVECRNQVCTTFLPN